MTSANDKPGTNGKPVTGSPVTAATPPNDAANEVKAAEANTTSNNQSTKPVGGVGTIGKNDPDHTSKNDPDEGEVDTAKPLTRAEERELETILDGGEDTRKDNSNTLPTNESLRKLFQILKAIPKDTPDEHPLWGAGGVTMTLGDLKNIAREI